MAKPVEFRFLKKHFVHDGKILKTASILQSKDKEGYWNDIYQADEIIKLAKAEDLVYYT